MNILEQLLDSRKSITDRLFEVTTDHDIYEHLLGHDIILYQERVSSPLRPGDDNPSLGFYNPTNLKGREKEVWFKDFTTDKYGDIFSFCRQYAAYQHGLKLNSRYEIVKFIDGQLDLGLFDGSYKIKRRTFKPRYAKPKILQDIKFVSRPFTKNDLKYWIRFGITEKILKKYDVRSVKYILDDKGDVREYISNSNLCFVYCINGKVKLYKPLEVKERKWRNTCPSTEFTFYQGFAQIVGTKADTLIITKSLKDVMTFAALMPEVDAIAPQSETALLNEKFVELAKKKYKYIILIYDYDRAGVMQTNKERKKNGFDYAFISTRRISINGKLQVIDKDISDYVDAHGVDSGIRKTKEIIMTIKQRGTRNQSQAS